MHPMAAPSGAEGLIGTRAVLGEAGDGPGTEVPVKSQGAVRGTDSRVAPLVRSEPYMLINSPRAKLPLGAAIGAAFWMRKICGACDCRKASHCRQGDHGNQNPSRDGNKSARPDMFRGVLAFLASSICA